MTDTFKSGVVYTMETVASIMEELVYNSMKKEQTQFNHGYLQAIKDIADRCVERVTDNIEEVENGDGRSVAGTNTENIK